MKDDVFVTRVRQLLADRGLTYQQLEQQAGLKPGALNLYSASDRRPSADRLLAISRCLGTNPAYLMGYGDEPLPLKPADRSFDRILGETIREQGWDLTELADGAGVPRKTLVNYLKKGSKPSLEKVERIASVMKVEPAYLLGWQGEPEEVPAAEPAPLPEETIEPAESPEIREEQEEPVIPAVSEPQEEEGEFVALETFGQLNEEEPEDFQLTSIFHEEPAQPDTDYFAVNEIAQLPEEPEEEFHLTSMFDEYPELQAGEDDATAGFMALENMDEPREEIRPSDIYDHYVADIVIDAGHLETAVRPEPHKEKPVRTAEAERPVRVVNGENVKEKVVYLNRGIDLRDYKTENLIVMAVALAMSVLWFLLLLVQTERWKFDRLILFGFPMVMLLFSACVIIYFIIKRVNDAASRGKGRES